MAWILFFLGGASSVKVKRTKEEWGKNDTQNRLREDVFVKIKRKY